MNLRVLCFVWLMLSITADSRGAAVDRLFAEWDSTNSPGCFVIISKDGEVIYERGFGMANVELSVPITSASVMPVASVSKQFTAMSILLLAERHQLSLDDPVW